MKLGKFEIWETVLLGRNETFPLFKRINIVKTPWWALRFHHFYRSDPSCLHDHPWSFITLILSGGYYEQFEDLEGRLQVEWRPPGTILFRPARFRHRVVLGRKEPRTLVLTGKRVRDWGFWTVGKGWVWHRLFRSQDDDCAAVWVQEERLEILSAQQQEPVYLEEGQ